MKVWQGNKVHFLSDLFEIRNENTESSIKTSINIKGDLRKVRGIGSKMSNGRIVIEGSAGLRLGEMMKGGEILVTGSVDSWIGAMMSGGRIEIQGSAGSYIGTPYRGIAVGMKEGSIIIHGDGGNEVGTHMIGGLIKIDGNVKEFCGANMHNGTILVRGNSKGRAGAGMIDGRIVICGIIPSVLPTFSIESIRKSVKVDGEEVIGPFYRFEGDIADGGKGKLYISKELNVSLNFYEKYL